MDVLLGLLGAFFWVPILFVLVVVGLFYTRSRYKIAKADEALVVTGGKKGPQVYKGGGAFVSPFRKHQFFPIGVMTVRSSDQETQSKTLVPVVVKWTAQLRPDTETEGALEKAIIGFSGMGNDEHISASLQQTLDGEIRAVVATMTPEEVVTNKESFAKQVMEGVTQQMQNLGFTLVSLNIAEVSDKNDYYRNLAAKDREVKRQDAETLTANANKEVAVAQAAANLISESATLDKDLAIAEKNRDVSLQKAGFKAETDIAEKDAEYAGQLRTEARRKELAASQGEVKVIEEQQAQAASIAHREVELSDAETAARKLEIDSSATAKKVEIDAAASAKKLEIDTSATAKAAKLEAEGKAEAVTAQAKGTADALNLTTDAEARKEREVGLAQAEVIRARGTAEAEAALAKGKSDAEAQRLMAEALAANDGANLKVTLAEIESKTKITIYTEAGKAMATVGEKATFIDMSGSASRGEGSLFENVLGGMPSLLKRLDVENTALNGEPLGGSLGALIAGILGRKDQAVTPDETPVSPDPQGVAGAEVPVEAATNAARTEAADSVAKSASDVVTDVATVFPTTSKKSSRSVRDVPTSGESDFRA